MVTTLSFDEAWAGYRRWEHRMPAKPPLRTARRVFGLVEILDQFDAVILDNFGVLSLGDPAIDAGAPALAAVRRSDKPLRILTNDGAKSIEAMLAGHQGRGYAFRAAEIIPGYQLLEQALAGHLPAKAERAWGVIGLNPSPLPALTQLMIPLTGGGIEEVDTVAGVVFLDTSDWRATDQQRLVASLRAELRPVIVCNPDLTAPYPERLSIEPGWPVNQLADSTGVEPVFLGKPFADIYDVVLGGLDHIPRERIIAVGDTPHTDVLGAHAAGIKSLLVETGFTRGRDAAALMEQAGIVADYVAATI